ncbi:MAG: cobalt-precorrin-5B (C1)-methyltransferase [Candidatus Desulfovibrio kirbyi]|uniref:Cobalt-precorrin-5B C(1)-methyltransferase n=1 Tax=Candidatus Desulfovibrio kirbyi TaxID=2696086 RepID=A0A6L2R7L8_9BACT|nr:MAG: cobalt-precorrin-5B (C1)-methyltransferase [Candidatus Desulfovibrio kirbyi]
MASASLREGFTTGSAAAAAALAALRLLCEGRAPAQVDVSLPPGAAVGTLHLPIETCAPCPVPELAKSHSVPAAQAGRVAHATVRKDGGDDPDVTHGALVSATVVPDDKNFAVADNDFVRIEGGPGVGRVTLPGLPVAVGHAAINPGPLAQIRHTLARYAADRASEGLRCPPVTVTISVPKGENLADRTLNPRLGIMGGISILGTHGTTRPFSHAAYKKTIQSAISVAFAANSATLCLCTGRRSEKLLQRRFPALAPQNFIQVADFVKFSLSAAGKLPFGRIVWGCFFGKLVKLMEGKASTHATASQLSLSRLAGLCGESRYADAVAACVTAAQALDILLAQPEGVLIVKNAAAIAAATAGRFAGRVIDLHLFHTDGRELCTL